MLFRTVIRKELSQVASATFITLLTIIISMSLIRTLGAAANGRVDNNSVLSLILFSSMNYLSVILVLTTFMSVIVVVSRAFRDREMTAWMASGLSLASWMRPVLRFSIPMTLLALAFSLFISPWARQQSEQVKERFEKRSDVSKVAAGQFRESSGGTRVFFIEKENLDRSVVDNVFVASREGDYRSLILARSGQVVTQPNGERFLELREGQRVDANQQSSDFSVLQFEKYGIRLEPGFYLPADTSNGSKSVVTLWAENSSGARAELLWRLGLPLSALCLSLMAIPLSFVNPRAGRSLNLVFALLIYLVYSNVMSIMQARVAQGNIGFATGLLAPHVLALILFGWMMYQRLSLQRPWIERIKAVFVGRAR